MNLQHTADKVIVVLGVALSELMRMMAVLALGGFVLTTSLAVMSAAAGNSIAMINNLIAGGPLVTFAIVFGVGHFVFRVLIKETAPVRPPIYG